jgi:hypothetical protein
MHYPTKSFFSSRRHKYGEWYVNPESISYPTLNYVACSSQVLASISSEVSYEILTPLLVQNTIIQDIDTSTEDFIFYFDRIATLLVEQ